MTPTYKFAKDAELLSECIEKSSLYENLTIDIRDIPYYEVSEEDSLYYMHEADITQFFVKELRSDIQRNYYKFEDFDTARLVDTARCLTIFRALISMTTDIAVIGRVLSVVLQHIDLTSESDYFEPLQNMWSNEECQLLSWDIIYLLKRLFIVDDLKQLLTYTDDQGHCVQNAVYDCIAPLVTDGCGRNGGVLDGTLLRNPAALQVFVHITKFSNRLGQAVILPVVDTLCSSPSVANRILGLFIINYSMLSAESDNLRFHFDAIVGVMNKLTADVNSRVTLFCHVTLVKYIENVKSDEIAKSIKEMNYSGSYIDNVNKLLHRLVEHTAYTARHSHFQRTTLFNCILLYIPVLGIVTCVHARDLLRLMDEYTCDPDMFHLILQIVHVTVDNIQLAPVYKCPEFNKRLLSIINVILRKRPLDDCGLICKILGISNIVFSVIVKLLLRIERDGAPFDVPSMVKMVCYHKAYTDMES